jgi:hypothetical protein
MNFGSTSEKATFFFEQQPSKISFIYSKHWHSKISKIGVNIAKEIINIRYNQTGALLTECSVVPLPRHRLPLAGFARGSFVWRKPSIPLQTSSEVHRLGMQSVCATLSPLLGFVGLCRWSKPFP